MGELTQYADQISTWLQANMGDNGVFAVAVLKIIWINILLSGDNAVVIALACRSLPPKQRMWGIILGAGAAVVLRIIFTVGIQYVLTIPYLKLVGGLLLLWIAVKLVLGEEADEDSVKESEHIWGAVRTVAIADMVMSLDNVLAIAAAARGDRTLIVLGLVISIPLIVAGATLIMGLLTRFPILVWAGAALLGWIAGELLFEEPILTPYFEQAGHLLQLDHARVETATAAAGAAIVVLIGWVITRFSGGHEESVGH